MAELSYKDQQDLKNIEKFREHLFCQDSAVNISDLWKSAKAPIPVKTTLMIWVYFFTFLKRIIPILRTKTFIRFPLRFWT